MSFYGSKILIAGGAGFVGSNLAHNLLSDNPAQLIIIDNLLSSDSRNIPTDSRVEFLHGSINDPQILDAIAPDIDYAFNLMCYHGNQSSIVNPFEDHVNNTLSALTLFEKLSRQENIKKVVYAAAACAVAEKTYDDPTPTTETQPISLFHDSPYSISKIIGELYGNYFYQRQNLPFVKARFSNVYGPREILGAGQWRGTVNTVWRNVIPTFIWKALNQQALPLDNGGNTSRDFIFVEDMVEGLKACALEGKPGDTYNLATGRETTILRVAELVNEITKNPTPLDLKPARDWDKSGKRFASTAKAETELGFVSKVAIEEGLRKTIQWVVDNELIISENIAKHEHFMKKFR
jgi:UDP-glucose 4-epimerase